MIGMRLPIKRGLGSTLIIAALSLALAACGSSDGTSRLDNLNNGVGQNGNGTNGNGSGENGNGNGNGDIDDDGSSIPELNLYFGSGDGDDFQEGVVGMTVTAALTPGGSAGLSVTLVDEDGARVNDPLDVSFESPCLRSGDALIGDISSGFGQASATYTANGCEGEDRITAYLGIGDSTLSASTTIEIDADVETAIRFVESDRDFISIKHVGGLEVATVTFQVLGRTLEPIRGAQVNFSLSGANRDVILLDETAISDREGMVKARVESGYAATTVRVTAKLDEADAFTQSSMLVVSSGIPVQSHFSVSASDLHPLGLRVDGVPSEITVRMADQFGNPVPDGTAAYLTTTSGAIEPGCMTENGACTVIWTSQNPRPSGTGNFSVNQFGETTCTENYECRAGRVLIMATAIGNESFIDLNQNGRYDPGTDFFGTDGNCAPNVPRSAATLHQDLREAYACDDLGDAYLDTNRNRVHDDGQEPVWKTAEMSSGTSREPGNGIYDGILCREGDADAGHCTRETVVVRGEMVLVLPDENVYVDPMTGRLPGQPASVNLGFGERAEFSVGLADANGNLLPPGTTVSVDVGSADNIDGRAMPGDLAPRENGEPNRATILLSASPQQPASGTVFIVVDTGGLVSNFRVDINP